MMLNHKACRSACVSSGTRDVEMNRRGSRRVALIDVRSSLLANVLAIAIGDCSFREKSWSSARHRMLVPAWWSDSSEAVGVEVSSKQRTIVGAAGGRIGFSPSLEHSTSGNSVTSSQRSNGEFFLTPRNTTALVA